MPGARPHLVLYSAPQCCLCETLKAQLEALRGEIPFQLEVVDISGSPELESRFRLEIPVLFMDGRKVAKYRIETSALRRALQARG